MFCFAVRVFARTGKTTSTDRIHLAAYRGWSLLRKHDKILKTENIMYRQKAKRTHSITALLLTALLALTTACSAANIPNTPAQKPAQAPAQNAAGESTGGQVSPPEGLSYEVKFLINPETVLDQDHVLKEEWQQALGIAQEYQSIEVMYLETPDRGFLSEGWINRLRRKPDKKKVELTYKKRYPVTGTDIAAACRTAAQDGFEVQETEGREAKGAFEASIDWGYEKMTLSFGAENSVKLKGIGSLYDLPVDDAKNYFADAMPDEEADWKASQWGITTLEKAGAAGPFNFLRAKGMLKGREVTLEIWPLKDPDQNEDPYLVELSFKTDTFEDASYGKTEITEYLDQKGILLHEDSLKTGHILDAWLK